MARTTWRTKLHKPGQNQRNRCNEVTQTKGDQDYSNTEAGEHTSRHRWYKWGTWSGRRTWNKTKTLSVTWANQTKIVNRWFCNMMADCISRLLFILSFLNRLTAHFKNDNALKWVVCCWKLSLSCDVTASRNTAAGGRCFAAVISPVGADVSPGVHVSVTSRLNSRCFRCVSLQTCGLCIAGVNWSINISETRRTVGTPVQQVWPFNARLAQIYFT